MMAFFNLTKQSKVLMAFILILTLVATYAMPLSVYAVPAPPEPVTKNFNVNLFNYDQATVNDAARALHPHPADWEILTFFGGNSAESPVINRSEPSKVHNSVYTGLVKNNLKSSGSVEYYASPKTIELFDTGSANYVSKKDVAFPFIYDDGYYEYNSANRSATYQDSGNKVVLGAANGGFWPFGNIGQAKDYHFGLDMELDFYIPDDRLVDGDQMVFNFSGDDDVWVFVDGKLVLDLGGIHGTQGGSINFTTGVVTNPAKYTGTPSPDTSLDDDFDWKNDVTKGDFKEFSSHTIKVFYLERGAGESNFSMKFNVPQIEPISVEKELTGVNPGFTTDASFDFVIQTANPPRAESVSTYGPPPPTPDNTQSYDLYDKNGNFVASKETGKKGEFSLKIGEKAVFTKIHHQKWFFIYEKDLDSDIYCDEKWVEPDEDNEYWDVIADDGKNKIKGQFMYGAEKGDFELVCQNTLCVTDVTFDKLDSMFPIPVSGAAFELTAVSGVTGSAIASSTSSGSVTFEDVPVGVYDLKEIGAPLGYLLSDDVYRVIVGYDLDVVPDDGGPVIACCPDDDDEGDCCEGLEYVILTTGGELSVPISIIFNDPKMIDLEITKRVQGSYAPENASPAGVVLYPFIIEFGDGFELVSLGAITSNGAVGLEEYGDSDNRMYRFSLPKDGSITFPIKEGVGYWVYEDVYGWDSPTVMDSDSSDLPYLPYFMMEGDKIEDLNGDGGFGIWSRMLTESALTVLNQYGNDGLTLLKTVSGNQAPDSETAEFDFTAKFWTPESEELMETTLIGEAEQNVTDASVTLAAATAALTTQDAVDLEDARQAITDAAVTVAALKIDLDIASSEAIDAKAELDIAKASKAAIEEEITSLEAISTTDPAIAILEGEIAALGIDGPTGLQAVSDEADANYGAVKADYDAAVAEKEGAEADFETLKTNNERIKAYLDAQAALEAAQADLDEKLANTEQNIFERIWDRIAGFFINLVVGDTYEYGITDVAYSGNPSGFTFDGTTSQCAFSLGIADSITFNVDQYFEDNPEVDKVFFEIAETDDGGAKSTDILTVDDPFPGGFTTNPAVTENTIKGFVDRETMDPTIVYDNDFGNIYRYPYLVYHKTDGGTTLASYSAIGIVGQNLDLGPDDFTGYSFTTVSAVGMTITPDSGGNITDPLPDTEDSIIITFIYTADPTNDRPNNRRNRTTTTVVEEETPAAPVTPEPTPEEVILAEEIPAAPLPITGGVPAFLLYGLGVLLAGGGFAYKLKDKKEDQDK